MPALLQIPVPSSPNSRGRNEPRKQAQHNGSFPNTPQIEDNSSIPFKLWTVLLKEIKPIQKTAYFYRLQMRKKMMVLIFLWELLLFSGGSVVWIYIMYTIKEISTIKINLKFWQIGTPPVRSKGISFYKHHPQARPSRLIRIRFGQIKFAS